MALEPVSSLPEFLTILKTSGRKLVVVDFFATWCGPCQAIAPLFEQLARRYDGRARFLKVDVDSATDVAQHCSVSSMPTFHMYLHGKLVSEFSGADQRRLQADIERYAPSTADVSFSGAGQKLGAVGGEAAASSSAPAPVLTSDRSAREAIAAAAMKRLQAAQASAKAPEGTAAAGPVPADGENPSAEASGPQNDSRLSVNPLFLNQLVDEMGFPKIRAEKALILTGNKSVEQAVEWCFQHADDADVDEPLQVVTKAGENKPKLTPEEAKKKADELYTRARKKREEEEKNDAYQRERERLRSGKEVTEAKQKHEEEVRKRAVAEKKREKMEALKQRQRIREILEADKVRRREKFKMPGSSQAASSVPAQERAAPKPIVRPVATSGKIQFRMPDGSRLEGSFEPEHTMGDLITFLSRARPDLSSESMVLSQQYPRRKYSQLDYGSTLADLGLLPRGALAVSFS